MIQYFKRILSFGPKINMQQLVAEGAQIIDVRTKKEFQAGYIRGAVNIPLQSLGNNLTKIKKEKTIITCCASGMRSASAKSILKSNGFCEVYNGGGWRKLQNKIKQQ